MKIVVVGAGGVGGYFGGRLAHSGADVHFLARGVHLQEMRANGLVVEANSGKFQVPNVSVAETAVGLGTADLVIVAVKLGDTEAALDLVAPVVGDSTAFVSFQNGVLKDSFLRDRFGSERIIGGVCYVAASVTRPGMITQTGPLERLVFGEFDRRLSGRANEFLGLCQAAGIKAELSENIEREIWQKFVFLVGLSGTTATMDSPIGPIRENTQTRTFLLDVMREVVAVARARGVDLPEDYAQQRLDFADGVAPKMTSSLHHDLQQGKPLEVPWLAGSVVSMGAEVGVATPLNRAIADILALRANGGRVQ